MDYRKQLSQSVLNARAGVMFDSDDIENEKLARIQRTERIIRTVRTYARLKICGSEYAAITNILADLRHYCYSKNLSFRKLEKEAHALYQEEVDFEAGRTL